MQKRYKIALSKVKKIHNDPIYSTFVTFKLTKYLLYSFKEDIQPLFSKIIIYMRMILMRSSVTGENLAAKVDFMHDQTDWI